MWLRDFLPETVPDARIMSFGYDSRWLLNDGKATIADSARRLLILLNQKRVEPVSRWTSGLNIDIFADGR
jgi:hypothetical protein